MSNITESEKRYEEQKKFFRSLFEQSRNVKSDPESQQRRVKHRGNNYDKTSELDSTTQRSVRPIILRKERRGKVNNERKQTVPGPMHKPNQV